MSNQESKFLSRKGRKYSDDTPPKKSVNIRIEVNFKNGQVVGDVIEEWHNANIDQSIADDVDEGVVNMSKDVSIGSNYMILYANKGKTHGGFESEED